MTDVLINALIVLVLILGGAAVFVGGPDYLLALLVQRLVEWFQRVFLGIDEPRAGSETLIGQPATARRAFALNPESNLLEGAVTIQGELWNARLESGEGAVQAAETVEVAGRDGLVLLVRLLAVA